ncbi:MAG: hypothetical protein GY920_17280 [Aliivibrio sp.]|jgi:hypothetical protein|nr:hypothetical protein [Aliivibrio sp.]
MGQKAHPLALRQASKYRRQDNLWYSRRYRDQLLLKDMALRNYIDVLSTQQQMPKPRLAVQHGHNSSSVYAFICIPFTDRRDMATQCRVKLPTLPAPVQSSTMWSNIQKETSNKFITQKNYDLSIPGISNSEMINLVEESCNYQVPNTLSSTLTSVIYKQPLKVNKVKSSDMWMQNHISDHIESSLKSPVNWYPVAISSIWQDASFLADEIVWFLERRVSFRLLKRALARTVENMPNIQGVRVTVSGRVGGRSKKSNRARSETWKYGATPLHVFSREIDYAQRVARTPLGTSGVSVWLVQRS